MLARGLVVSFPEPMNQKAEAILISNGISMTGFTSEQLVEDEVTQDTLLLTMEQGDKDRILHQFSTVKEDNVFVLTEFVGEELEILDPYGNLYFFDENLMITINPKNGERLNLSQLTKIYSILKNQKEYLSALTEVEQFRKTINGAEYLMFVNNKGRELFERFYSNFQF